MLLSPGIPRRTAPLIPPPHTGRRPTDVLPLRAADRAKKSACSGNATGTEPYEASYHISARNFASTESSVTRRCNRDSECPYGVAYAVRPTETRHVMEA